MTKYFLHKTFSELKKKTFLSTDSFESTRTQPRSRKVRDVSGINSAAALVSNGAATIYVSVGSALLMLLSVTLAIYLYKNKRTIKNENVEQANI